MHTHEQFTLLFDRAVALLGVAHYERDITFVSKKIDEDGLLAVSQGHNGQDPRSILLEVSDECLAQDTQEVWADILHELVHVLLWPITNATFPNDQFSDYQRRLIGPFIHNADEECAYRFERILALHLPCPTLPSLPSRSPGPSRRKRTTSASSRIGRPASA